jgi:hypothetical protein
MAALHPDVIDELTHIHLDLIDASQRLVRWMGRWEKEFNSKVLGNVKARIDVIEIELNFAAVELEPPVTFAKGSRGLYFLAQTILASLTMESYAHRKRFMEFRRETWEHAPPIFEFRESYYDWIDACKRLRRVDLNLAGQWDNIKTCHELLKEKVAKRGW